jgi:hypothetical protein
VAVHWSIGLTAKKGLHSPLPTAGGTKSVTLTGLWYSNRMRKFVLSGQIWNPQKNANFLLILLSQNNFHAPSPISRETGEVKF